MITEQLKRHMADVHRNFSIADPSYRLPMWGCGTYMGVPVVELICTTVVLDSDEDVMRYIVDKANGTLPKPRRHGRPAGRPYTSKGIERLPCVRCGRRAHASWQACADDRVHRPLCKQCDIDLNELVLRWAGDPDWREKMERYRKKVMGEEG